MAKSELRTVDDYLAAQPEAARAVLAQVRAAIRKALPQAEEGIGYQIPAYRIAGRAVLYFAGWREHFSLYPVGESVATELGDAIEGYERSKGTLRFPLAARVPVRLIARIAKLRAAEEAGGAAKAKPRASRR